MKVLQNARAQLAGVAEAMGPLVLARSGEEHAGPHSAWFWDPTLQGGGVLSDMGCHCIAVGWYLLTPPGAPAALPRAARRVSADVGLLKWGQPRWRAELLDAARRRLRARRRPRTSRPAWSRTAIPRPDQRTKAQFTVSWMYDKQGLRLLIDGIGPGYALEANTPALTARGLHRRRGGGVASPTPSSRSRRRPRRRACSRSSPTSPTSTATPTSTSTRSPRSATGASALLDFDYGLEIVRLTMAAYLSAERRARRRPHRPRDPRRARRLRAR